jgi:hypothetical protein
MKKLQVSTYLLQLLFITTITNFCNAQNSLEQLILDKEAIVQNIKTQVLNAYHQRCDIECSCSLSACKSDLQAFSPECTDAFGGEPECASGCDAK